MPRSRAIRFGWPWVEGRTDDPWDVEAQSEPLELGDPAPRPKNIVNVEDAEAEEWERVIAACVERPLGQLAGAVRTGMRHAWFPRGSSTVPRTAMAPRKSSSSCSTEREPACSATRSIRCVGDRSSAARPGPAFAHAFRGPLTLLTYGTIEPNEICYYPRSNKIAFFGAGSHRPHRKLDYWDGEPLAFDGHVRGQALGLGLRWARRKGEPTREVFARSGAPFQLRLQLELLGVVSLLAVALRDERPERPRLKP